MKLAQVSSFWATVVGVADDGVIVTEMAIMNSIPSKSTAEILIINLSFIVIPRIYVSVKVVVNDYGCIHFYIALTDFIYSSGEV